MKNETYNNAVITLDCTHSNVVIGQFEMRETNFLCSTVFAPVKQVKIIQQIGFKSVLLETKEIKKQREREQMSVL